MWGEKIRCAEAGDLFGGRVPERMRETEAFPTKDMAAAAQDATPDLATTAGVLEHAFGLQADCVSTADRQQVRGCMSMSLKCEVELTCAAAPLSLRHGRSVGVAACAGLHYMKAVCIIGLRARIHV